MIISAFNGYSKVTKLALSLNLGKFNNTDDILQLFNFQNVREVISGMGQVLSENDYPHHIR